MIELCDVTTCTGCFSCYNICPQHCITMNMNEEGFYYPCINRVECNECKLCISKCHILSNNLVYNKGELYSAYSIDNKIQKKSSSGGLFTIISEYIISNNGYIFAASFDAELKLKHSEVYSINFLDKYKGSKYVQSYLGTTYLNVKNRLESGYLVLFIGTPCQVAGLLMFLSKNYSNLFTIDLICHGVPSQRLFDIYIQKINLSQKNIDNFYFRYLEGQGFDLSYIIKKKKKRIRKYDWYFFRAYLKSFIFMESCYNCKYATEKRISDITLGDFWGIKKKRQMKNGVSLVLLNTINGKCLFKNISNDIYFDKRVVDNSLIVNNPNLFKCDNKPIERNNIYNDFLLLSKNEVIKKYKLFPKLKDYIRSFRRLLFKY